MGAVWSGRWLIVLAILIYCIAMTYVIYHAYFNNHDELMQHLYHRSIQHHNNNRHDNYRHDTHNNHLLDGLKFPTKNIENVITKSSPHFISKSTEDNTNSFSENEKVANVTKKKIIIESQMDTERNIKSDIKSQTGTETNIESDIESQTDTETNIKSDIKSQTDTEGNIKSDIGPHTDIERSIKTNIGSQTDTERNVKSDIESQTDTEGNIKTDIESQAGTERNVKTDIEPQTDANRNVKTDIEPQAGTERKIKPDIESQTDAKRNVKTSIEPQAGTERNVKTDIESQTDAERKIKTDIESELDRERDTESSSMFESLYGKVKTVGSMSVINVPVASVGRYAVLGCAVHNRNYNYVFPLPIDVLTWSRAGFGTIVILVGKLQEWLSDAVLKHTLVALIDTNATIVFLPSKRQHAVMLSQVARIFVAKLFPWDTMEDTYIITADSDIWPINGPFYMLPRDKKIVSLNSDCCGEVRHKGRPYKMLPMCNIGMTIATWREVMNFKDNHVIQDSQDIIDYFAAEFGPVVDGPVEKGENQGWFLDQTMISIRIFDWAEKHNFSLVDYVRRDTGRDRIDRTYGWWPWRLSGRNDAHILEQGYKPGVWERLMPLLHLLLTEQQCSYLQQYRTHFLQAVFRTNSNAIH